MKWRPIAEVGDRTRILARDADDYQRWTWLDMGDWVYESWRENEDGDEWQTEEVWEPIEFADYKANPEVV